MPELPEVETIARELHERLAGRAIVDVRVIRPDILRQTDAVQLASACHAALIVRVWRRAKSVVVELSGKCFLVIQPRFTGSVQIDEPRAEFEPDPYSAIEWDLADGGRPPARRFLGRRHPVYTGAYEPSGHAPG